MLNAMRAWLLVVVLGCSGSQHGGRGSPEELGCTQDPAARAACDARGSAAVYGRDPLAGCSGNPGDELESDRAALHSTPCQCFERADYDQRQHDCMNMP
jgi:hypothetical protein